jgi:threonine dehydratase
VRLSNVGLFADGVAVREVGEETFRLCQQYVDEIILVDTDDTCAAIKDVFEDTRSILEPAGALAIAAAKAYAEREQIQGQTLIAVACGANMNFDRLRFVAERAEFGERREAIFAVTIPKNQVVSASSVTVWANAILLNLTIALRRKSSPYFCRCANSKPC